MNPSWIEYIAAVLFFLALIHTFSAKYFVQLSHRESRHSGAWLMLGEVEVIFGLSCLDLWQQSEGMKVL